MMVMEIFSRLFKSDCDEKADCDRGKVDKEVRPSVGGFMRWLNVEHV
jgi:hypothetical protein